MPKESVIKDSMVFYPKVDSSERVSFESNFSCSKKTTIQYDSLNPIQNLSTLKSGHIK